MNFKDWEPFYREILDDFGFSEEADIEAARLLNELLPADPQVAKLKDLIFGKTVNVFGAGPSLEKLEEFPGGTSIAADGATSFFIEHGRVPDIIVTDLDGRIADLLLANKRGSQVVIHAHGDNIPALKYVKSFGAPIGTTQAEAFGRLHNFGGFTDGDRAVFLAMHFGARRICLFGMDFGIEIGRYSFSENEALTRKKLLWAEKLIKYLNDKHPNIIRTGML